MPDLEAQTEKEKSHAKPDCPGKDRNNNNRE
jgi:hypothetical protein